MHGVFNKNGRNVKRKNVKWKSIKWKNVNWRKRKQRWSVKKIRRWKNVKWRRTRKQRWSVKKIRKWKNIREKAWIVRKNGFVLQEEWIKIILFHHSESLEANNEWKEK